MLPLLARALAKGAVVVEILPLGDVNSRQVDALLDAAFGADRHLRTAYLLRQGTHAVQPLCFAALLDGALVGSIQLWPCALFADRDGAKTPLLLVGPVAVAPEHQRLGIGRRLMEAMLAAAQTHADAALCMIGDPEYYGRFFQFSAAVTGGWRLPGPWEPRRLLARPVGEHAPPLLAGELRPDPR